MLNRLNDNSPRISLMVKIEYFQELRAWYKLSNRKQCYLTICTCNCQQGESLIQNQAKFD